MPTTLETLASKIYDIVNQVNEQGRRIAKLEGIIADIQSGKGIPGTYPEGYKPAESVNP